MSNELQDLREQIDSLQSQLANIENERAGGMRSSRRNMLRTLGAASVGAAAGGLALAQPAAAVNGDNLELGNQDATTNTASSATILVSSSAAGGLVVTDSGDASGKGATGAALVGSATGNGMSTGLYASGPEGGYGAKLAGETPLWLQSEETEAPTGSGSAGQFRQVEGDLYYSGGNGWTLLAGPNAPEYALASDVSANYATKAELDDYAMKSEIPDVPSFVPVTPFRVYDSRYNMAPMDDGLLSKGQMRTVSIRDKRSTSDGSIMNAGEVPSNAVAVAYTVTIVGMVSDGFVAVADGDASEYSASSINWASATPGAVANSSIVKVNGAGEIKLFVDGVPGCATNVIVDIVGWFLPS